MKRGSKPTIAIATAVFAVLGGMAVVSSSGDQECAVQHEDNGLPFRYQVAVGHLEAVHEAVMSEIAACPRSGSESAIGKHNLIG